jgi:hypothetical protein
MTTLRGVALYPDTGLTDWVAQWQSSCMDLFAAVVTNLLAAALQASDLISGTFMRDLWLAATFSRVC